jgi:hypothetical protein
LLHPHQPNIIPLITITVTNPAMNTITTNVDFTHPTLPPFLSPTTDPSPLSIDNEEVVVLDVVSLASTEESLHASYQCKHSCCCWQGY